MVDDFNTRLKADLDNIFLQEFSKDDILKSSTVILNVKIQFFKGDLDKLETLYTYAWGKYEDFNGVKKNDTLIVDNVEYGIVDFTHDEFKTTTTLFLEEV